MKVADDNPYYGESTAGPADRNGKLTMSGGGIVSGLQRK
jgi:hypothetical protein